MSLAFFLEIDTGGSLPARRCPCGGKRTSAKSLSYESRWILVCTQCLSGFANREGYRRMDNAFLSTGDYGYQNLLGRMAK